MLNNIQVLRAFAALNVVLFHIIGISRVNLQPPAHFQFLSGWGENGVDIFFVISGFVMVHAHAGKEISPLQFMKLRIHRIVPIYWIFTLLLFALFLLLPNMARIAAPTIGHLAASLSFLSMAVLGKPPVLYVGWTLEYEMLFYILFALSLVLKSANMRLLFQAVAILVLTLLGHVDPIIVEFVLGMLAARLYMQQRFRPYAATIAAVGVALLCASILYKFEGGRLIKWGIPSLLIVFGAASARQLRSRVLGYLGNASYSIYLVQVLAIPAFYRMSSRYLGFVQNDLLAVMALVFAAAVGCAFHQYMERPIGAWLKTPKPA